MVNFLHKIVGIFILSAILITTANAVEITAVVDRNPIPVGESFRFILEANGSVDEDPDFTELHNKFRVLSTSQSSNLSFINGSMTKTKTWIMVLIADKPGSFIIPEINFGQDKSDAIAITVSDTVTTQDSEQSRDIYLEVNVEPKSVYVQQQVIYSIKLFRRIQIANASLSEPVSENNQAIITKLGKDTDKRVVVDGVAYSVLERRYAIFPQKSGKLKIPSITFQTQIVSNQRQRSFFNMDPFNSRGTIKQLQTKPVEIDVKGIPIEFTQKYPNAAWLPVDSLTISETWSGDVNSFVSGEPMTRTISLTAQNLTAAQLPEVKFAAPKTIKLYPDVPETAERDNPLGLIASKRFKTALMPTKVGQQELAEIVIPWWDTKSNSIQESKLPAKTITVIASSTSDDALNSNQSPEPNLRIDDNEAVALQEVDSNKSLNLDGNSGAQQVVSWWWIIACSVLALLWLVTLYLLVQLRAKMTLSESLASSNVTPVAFKSISTKQIKEACLNNNARDCSSLLLQWANAKTQSTQFTNISALRAFSAPELILALDKLESCLYQRNASDWDGSLLWSAFNLQPPSFTLKSQKKGSTPSLNSLYAQYD